MTSFGSDTSVPAFHGHRDVSPQRVVFAVLSASGGMKLRRGAMPFGVTG